MVLIRDHGPQIANARLVLHTLRSYMDDSGYTFVGQATIAAAACLSKPTVRKMLTIAWQGQWIGVSLQGRAGQEWRNYEYRACIPDRIEIPEKHDALVTAFAGKYGGDVDTDSHPDIAKLGKQLSHVNGHSGAQKPEGGKTDASKVGKSTLEGGKTETPKVGNGLSPKSSSAEVLTKYSSEEGAALSRSTAPPLKRGLRSKQTKEPEPELPELRVNRIRVALKAFANHTDVDIARMAGVRPDEVQLVRNRA